MFFFTYETRTSGHKKHPIRGSRSLSSNNNIQQTKPHTTGTSNAHAGPVEMTQRHAQSDINNQPPLHGAVYASHIIISRWPPRSTKVLDIVKGRSQ